MDLTGIREVRVARTRDDLLLAPGEAFLGGGTWLFSEQQSQLTGLVDLTALGWPSLEADAAGLTVAATCTLAELTAFAPPAEWPVQPLFAQACQALLASFKVQSIATVGGNICTALPAGAMTSLFAALDADAVIWTSDGGERREPVATFVAGVRTTTLRPGEVLRALRVPTHALRARSSLRKIALSPLGRSGALVIGRVDPDGAAVFTVTASTPRPYLLRFEALPSAEALERGIRSIDDWYDDPHGAPDWREAMSALLAEEIRQELSA
jgi:CO/xanthine dehydrogenase FAD-binding subunit